MVEGGRFPGVVAVAFGAVERELSIDVVGVFDGVEIVFVAVDAFGR